MTKRLTAVITIALCAGVGILRWIDLAGNTDPATGYLLSGQVPVRYILLAMPVLAMLLASLTIAADVGHSAPAGGMVPAFCGMLFCGIIGIGLFVLQHSDLPQLAAAVLLTVGSLWFSGYVVHPDRPPLIAGLAATAGWLLVCIMLFTSKIASVHHMLPVLELLCTLGVLLQLAGLLRAVYAAGQKGGSRSLFFRSMLSFYCGFCLLLPQEIWQWQNDIAAGFLQGKCVAAAALGITGLVTALHCAFDEGTLIVDADDPAAVQAVFDDAGRRLEQLLKETPVNPVPDEDAGRWHSAASTLYGGAPAKPAQPQPTPQPAPAQPQNLFETAPAPAPKAPAAPVQKPADQGDRPVIVTDDWVAPAAVPPTPAGAMRRAPQPADQTPERPVAAAQPADAKPRDPVDDILADLGLFTPPAAAKTTEHSGDDRWVFRR